MKTTLSVSTKTVRSAEILELMERHPSLKEFILTQQQQLEFLGNRVTELETAVKKLRDQLKLDSHNSSKPPSSDIQRPSPKSLRQKSKRNSGGQPGPPGSTLQFSSTVNHVHPHPVSRCDQCGLDLQPVAIHQTERRQVFDLPPMNLEVTEHQGAIKVCPRCRHLQKAVFPAGVDHPTQDGERYKALMVYLNQYQRLPLPASVNCSRI